MKTPSARKNVAGGTTRPSIGPRGVKGRRSGTITVAKVLRISGLLGLLR